MKNKNHLIIDCSNIIHGAFHTTGNLSYDGKQTGIIYGFLRKILTFAKKYYTNRLYFCFDHPYSKRKEEYPEYKENRKKRLEKLTNYEVSERQKMADQAIELHDIILPKMGFKNVFRRYGYEADDLMAIIVSILFKQNKQCLMITSDNDMYQCLDKCDIINPKTLKRFTQKILLDEYRVKPNQWPICKAIGGCFGDNVIGIKGISDPKIKASKVLKYMNNELNEDTKIFKSIHSNKGIDITKRNLPIVSLPYKPDEMIPIIMRRDQITKSKIVNVFGTYNFKSLLKQDMFKHWERIFCK